MRNHDSRDTASPTIPTTNCIAIYLAAAFARRDEMDRYRIDCERAGLAVASTWHRDPTDVTPEHLLTHAQKQAIAQRDLDDLDRADVLVLFGDPPGGYAGNGGKYTEYGYALGMGIPVVLVSFREGVYGHLPEAVYCPDPDAALTYLAGLRRDSRGRAA